MMTKKIKNEDQFIFKYYAPTKYNIEALKEGYFWFSKKENLNDPFDLGNFKKGSRLILRYEQFMRKTLADLGSDAIEIDSLIPSYACCSFTKNQLNKLMWAYYAKNYRGWCLAFTRGHLRVQELSPLQPVIYIDPNMSTVTSIQSTNSIDALKQILRTKHVNWKHEEEERIIIKIPQKEKGASRKWGTYKLRYIIIGHKMSSSYKSKILQIAQEKRIPVYRISLDNADFTLNMEKMF